MTAQGAPGLERCSMGTCSIQGCYHPIPNESNGLYRAFRGRKQDSGAGFGKQSRSAMHAGGKLKKAHRVKRRMIQPDVRDTDGDIVMTEQE